MKNRRMFIKNSGLIAPAGDGIPEHKHLHEDEFLYIHSGTAILTVGDIKEEVSNGGLAYVPKKNGTALQIQVMKMCCFILVIHQLVLKLTSKQ